MENQQSKRNVQSFLSENIQNLSSESDSEVNYFTSEDIEVDPDNEVEIPFTQNGVHLTDDEDALLNRAYDNYLDDNEDALLNQAYDNYLSSLSANVSPGLLHNINNDHNYSNRVSENISSI